jgi:hypothetical protein
VRRDPGQILDDASGLSRLIDPGPLPRPRAVVRFDLSDASRPDRYRVVAGCTAGTAGS